MESGIDALKYRFFCTAGEKGTPDSVVRFQLSSENREVYGSARESTRLGGAARFSVDI